MLDLLPALFTNKWVCVNALYVQYDTKRFSVVLLDQQLC